MIKTVLLNSLAKVFPNYDLPLDCKKTKGSMLKNEAYSFQVAYRFEGDSRGNASLSIKTEHDLGKALTYRYVETVPCDFTMYTELPHGQLLHPEATAFPDVLRPGNEPLWINEQQWRSVWFTIDGTKKALKPGIHKIKITFTAGQDSQSVTFTIDIKDKKLPKQKLICTNWFHTDSLCHYYHMEFNSDRYWEITENFARTAVEYGINMLLTPLFTPPLDTVPGGERLTVQLVGVAKTGEKYDFDFTLLKKWVEMCKRVGVEYYEMSHLFTQWGCYHAPKIMATVNGKYKRIFGWETDAHGKAYKDFLGQFLPELTAFLKAEGIASRTYFHVSDEPGKDVLESYRESAEFLMDYVGDFKRFDALSDIEIYNTGCVPCPVPGIDHMDPFLKADIKERWTYYCCGQVDRVSNRFLAFPSIRNRILGVQLFKYDIKGFLQWGYNFYNSQGSIRPIDPYNSTTGGGWVPGGDTFVVYPDFDGKPIASLRLEVFREALQDMRACQALAKKIGKEEVEKLIGKKLTFTDYSLDPNKLIKIREKINEML